MKLDPMRCRDDISDADAEKNAERDYCRQVLAHVGAGVIVVDSKETVRLCNPMAEKLTGLKAAAMLGRKFTRVLGPVLTETGALNFLALRHIVVDTAVETTTKSPLGPRRYLRIHAAPLQTADGEAGGHVLTLQDLTHVRKEAQENQRVRGLATVGDMAAKIAHEIRNPLGCIALFASSISSEPGNPVDARELADHIAASVESINAVIENMLIATNPHQKLDFGDIDLRETLKDSLFFAGHLFSSNRSVRVASRFDTSPLNVWGDQQLLKQVFLNLVLNAIQAMPRGGQLTVEARKVEDDDTGKRYAEVRVIDTGGGIPAADLVRIFDPYFTTKQNGTGLGMSIVHNIVSAHKGTIDIYSEPNKGTACVMRLPLTEDCDTALVRRDEGPDLQVLEPDWSSDVTTVHFSC